MGELNVKPKLSNNTCLHSSLFSVTTPPLSFSLSLLFSIYSCVFFPESSFRDRAHLILVALEVCIFVRFLHAWIYGF